MVSTGLDKNMVCKRKSRRQHEFGDFQTPSVLAGKVCSLLTCQGIPFSSVLEPNCGKGSFLLAAIEHFPSARNIVGIDICREYVDETRSALSDTKLSGSRMIRVLHADFFDTHWEAVLRSLPDPLLVLGNPPWVTNADLGLLGSSNLPPKSNFQKHQGLDAITGKSNFDISEWMLRQELGWISGRHAILAMLCKTSVARKVLREAWEKNMKLRNASIYRIDAQEHFGVSVDACLLVTEGGREKGSFDCSVFDSLEAERPAAALGYRNAHLVSNTVLFDRLQHLEGKSWFKWRSGIKHDCAKVMELREENGRYRNGFGELIELESNYLFPMLKSSDVAKNTEPIPSRWMIVTQRSLGEDTRQIRQVAPKTWDYLVQYAQYLDRRSSSIYRSRPRFSMFGVGDYSFSNWKVAISGLYKKLDFRVIRPYRVKPVVLDDTCYFVACHSEEEAAFLSQLLNSELAREFFSSLVFWDEKRPVTLALLARLNTLALAQELNLQATLKKFLHTRHGRLDQLSLFDNHP